MGQANDNLQGESPGWNADDRFVHSLLLQFDNPTARQHREQRIQRVMLAIRQLGTTTSPVASPPLAAGDKPPRSAWVWRGTWAAAAIVLIVAGIFFTFSYSSTPALASINEILGALDRPGDRTFRIQVQPLNPDAQPRVGLNGATLYLRDGKQYLLARLHPGGGLLVDGYDGQHSWRIRTGTVVETKNGPGAGGLGMPQAMSETLFTDLQPTLQRIRLNYSIERLDQAPLPSGGAPLRHVLARRNSRAVKGPVVIEIWADPETGMPRRIAFGQAKFQGNPEPRSLTFDLVSEASLPLNWFTPQAHTVGTTGNGNGLSQ